MCDTGGTGIGRTITGFYVLKLLLGIILTQLSVSINCTGTVILISHPSSHIAIQQYTLDSPLKLGNLRDPCPGTDEAQRRVLVHSLCIAWGGGAGHSVGTI